MNFLQVQQHSSISPLSWTMTFSLIILLLHGIPSHALKDVVRLCGCPETSACPDNCGFFILDECQPLYQCFLEANGIFGYTKPERAADGEILVHMYNDANCQVKKFDTASNGFKGACDLDCWSTTSQMGAQFCGILDGPNDEPSVTADDQEGGIVQMCACPNSSACPGNCEVFLLNVCQPFYQCLQEPNGVFGFVRPELQPDGDVLVHIYDDIDCETERFTEVELIENGWKGSCQEECWGEASNVGAVACGKISATGGDSDDGDSSSVVYGWFWIVNVALSLFATRGGILV